MTSTTLPRSNLTPHLSGWRGGGEGGYSGPPMLLIHGVGLCADAWGPMLPILTRYFDVTAVDLPGHGNSPVLAGNSLGDYSATIAEVLAGTDTAAIVVGHSLGALIALDLARREPQKIAAIIPLNAIYRRSQQASEAVKVRVQELSGNQAADPTNTLVRWFGKNPKGAMAGMSDACRRWLTEIDPEGYRCAYQIFADEDGPADAALKDLACPALFITGADEPNSTPEMSQTMARLTPRGRAVIVDGARHMMPMTHAAEVCAHLLEFIKHLDGSHDPV